MTISAKKICYPTQAAVAEASCVSQETVSHILGAGAKGRCYSAKTRERVFEVAKRLGYRPQPHARTLRSGRSHIIGAVCHSGIYHASQERVRHLTRCAIRSGYRIVSVDLGWFDGDVASAQDYLFGAITEGIIFCNISAACQTSWKNFIEEYSLPVVSMNGALDFGDLALVDMRSAFRDMTLHHMEQGSRQLHLLLSYHDTPRGEHLMRNQKARAEGFVDAILSVGGVVNADRELCQVLGLPFPVRQDAAIQGHIHSPKRIELYEDVVDMGYFEAKRLLQSERCQPDSLICSNDHIAAGAIAACGEVGIRIPEAVRVSGSDNDPVSRYRGVQLTTIEQPAQLMAEWSVHRMVKQIETPKEERESSQKEFFPCELIIRSSTVPDPVPVHLTTTKSKNHL